MEHLPIPFSAIMTFFAVLPMAIIAIGFFAKSVSTEDQLEMHH